MNKAIGIILFSISSLMAMEGELIKVRVSGKEISDITDTTDKSLELLAGILAYEFKELQELKENVTFATKPSLRYAYTIRNNKSFSGGFLKVGARTNIHESKTLFLESLKEIRKNYEVNELSIYKSDCIE